MTPNVFVEGRTDEPVVRKITTLAGWNPELVWPVPVEGKSKLDQNIARYNDAALWFPQFVLRDLDEDKPCAGELRMQILPVTAPFMCFRIAVRSTEAWLMADPETLAQYLHISLPRIPAEPDLVSNPKDELVNLARSSTKPNVFNDIVPKPGMARRTGSGYPTRIIDYSANHWRPEFARQNSPSLHRAIVALERLHRSWRESTQ